MIVGTTTVDNTELFKYQGCPEQLTAFARSLVPIWARHIPGIVDNQRYFIALHVRKILSIQFYTRKEMIDNLVTGIKITGIINEFISIADILDMCDRVTLRKMLEAHYNEQ